MLAPNRCKTLRTARLKGRSADPFCFELLAHMQASIPRKAVRTLHIDLADASPFPLKWVCCDNCKCCDCPTYLGLAEVIVQLHIGTDDDITSRDHSLYVSTLSPRVRCGQGSLQLTLCNSVRLYGYMEHALAHILRAQS
jgi:hypothetical protein